MKKILCVLFALLLFHSDYSYNGVKYYVCVIYQNGQIYEEFMNGPYLELVVRDFVFDSSLESVFITRDINYVRQSESN